MTESKDIMPEEAGAESVWLAGENKAVGAAFVVGFLNAVAQWELGWVAIVHGLLTWFSLWFVICLAQIFTRAFMVTATAIIMAWQDGPPKGRRRG